MEWKHVLRIGVQILYPHASLKDISRNPVEGAHSI